MKSTTAAHGTHLVFVATAVVALALELAMTATGQYTFVWAYLPPFETIENAAEIPTFSLGRFRPDLPAMHVAQPNCRRFYEGHSDQPS